MNKKDIELIESIKTPAYVLDERLLKANLEILKSVQDRTGAKILLALKAFSMFSEFDLIGKYLYGVTSSSLNEAILGREYMNKEVHIYAPAYRPDEVQKIASICDHIVFNTPAQLKAYKKKSLSVNHDLEFGLRINPEYSEVEVKIYDPCDANSRLGSRLPLISDEDFDLVDGLHFHTMCEQDADVLERTLEVVEEKFGKYLHKMKWVNFGGGHHITAKGYDVEKLIKLINRFMGKYDLQVYLEPGEAIPLNCGFLVTSVLDIIENHKKMAILDTSASCHMPDVIEMPYRAHIINSYDDNTLTNNYQLGGPTCLSGDVIGDYSFDHPLKIGDKLIFTDMAHYTMVKNNTFNGVNLPSIAILNDEGIKVIKEFGYQDFKSRLS